MEIEMVFRPSQDNDAQYISLLFDYHHQEHPSKPRLLCHRWAARNSWHQKWCPYLRAQQRITTTSDVTCGHSEWSLTSCCAATRPLEPTVAPTVAGSAERTAALARSFSLILYRYAFLSSSSVASSLSFVRVKVFLRKMIVFFYSYCCMTSLPNGLDRLCAP